MKSKLLAIIAILLLAPTAQGQLTNYAKKSQPKTEKKAAVSSSKRGSIDDDDWSGRGNDFEVDESSQGSTRGTSLSDYANSQREVASDMRRIEKQQFDNACMSPTREAFKQYLRDYPDGKYVAEAQARLADFDLWDQAQSTDTQQAYQDYKNKSVYKFFITDADAAIATCQREEKLRQERYYKDLERSKEALTDSLRELHAQIKSLKTEIANLKVENTVLGKQIKHDKDVETEYDKALTMSLQEIDARKSSQQESDKMLLRLASNFLYIPYEDYSINKIALPAFASVHDETLRSTYDNRLVMLNNYRSDVQELVTFLATCTNVTSSLARQKQEELVKLAVYKRYAQYSDQETFLSKVIARIQAALSQPSQTDIIDIKEELTRCLNT